MEISSQLTETAKTTRVVAPASTVSVIQVVISSIDANPYQPRQYFDEDKLQKMADSIKKDGVLQPVILTPSGIANNGRYCVVAGERRVQAATMAGLTSIPAIIKSMSDADTLRIALIENIQRSDLNAVEEATAYSVLIENFGFTHEQCAEQIGRERSTVSNLLRILKLPAEIRNDLVHERMSLGHCRALLALSTVEAMLAVRKQVLQKGLNVRQTELLCKSLCNDEDDATKPKAANPDLEHLAAGLRDHLRTKVRVSGSGSRGKIEISYFSPSELERITALLGV
ncbi:MAG: ParB/RepB/Spo0J family partition protein [Pseudomonadota bacterium]|nr:ParB/RepB/Spo0J family partition protein [Pseudomonadota bacterium]